MAAEPPPAGRKGVRLPGSPMLWAGVLAVVVVGGGYLIWKRGQSGSSSGTGTAAAGTSADTGSSDAAELGTLQTEIGDLQSSEAQDSAQVQVPSVIGMKQEDAFGAISAAGLHPAGAPVQPGKILYVKAQSPGAGALVKKGTVVALQSATKPGPKPKPKPRKPPPRKKVAA